MTSPRLALVFLALLLLGGCNDHDSSGERSPETARTEPGDDPATLPVPATRDGEEDARREIESGKLALETYGLRKTPSAYEEFLTARGVEFRVVAGCIVDARIVDHAEGFNRVMKDAIRKKLGPDIFEKAEAQARPE